ncbi:hypothetical protein D3C87_1424440 [compost metagenome]
MLSFCNSIGTCSRICGISRWSTAISNSTSSTTMIVSRPIISVTPIKRGTRRRWSQSTPGVRMYAKMNANRKGVSTGASATMAANRPAATTTQIRIRLESGESRGAFIERVRKPPGGQLWPVW